MLITVALIIDRANSGSGASTAVLALIICVCSVWVFFAIDLRRGEHGPNRFGSDPLEGAV